jgi:hypothetical protein
MTFVLRLAAISSLLAGSALLALPSPAAATSQPTAVALGSGQSLPSGSTDLGTVAATTPMRLEVVLQPSDRASLGNFLREVHDPASSAYHRFLPRGQFGPRFGASPGTISQVTSALSSLGLNVGPVSANDLFLPVSTTAGRAAAAFGAPIHRYRLPSGRLAFANADRPHVPSAISPDLVGILDLSNVASPQPLDAIAPMARRHLSAAPLWSTQGTGPTPCAAEQTAAASLPTNTYSADQLAHAYGFDTGAYANGHSGAGETVALYELGSFSGSDVAAYESCYGIATTVNIEPVDGGAVAGSGSGETTLDVEVVAGLAPEATIDVYQGSTVGNFIDPYTAIATDDRAQVVSTSWGACEANLGVTAIQAEELDFLQMAAQGQSMIAAAGDAGSAACYQKDSSDTGLSVQDPASDPFVTGVGGTDLSATGPPVTESVWNRSTPRFGGGGGGISEFWQMPSWQRALGVNTYSSGAPCNAPSGEYCREVPDVSADADPTDGYAIYANGQWIDVAGTSAAAPLWAATASLADERCSGPAGLLNPALYANPGYLNDITVGNNDFTGTNGGLYPATEGYDMASGLGSPTASIFSSVALCQGNAEPLFTSAASDTTAAGIPFSYPVTTSATPAAVLSVDSASTLPSGVTFTDNGNGTGALAGVVPLPGTYSFGLEAANGVGPVATQSFILTVVTPAIPGAPSIATAAAGDGRVSVTFESPVSDGGSAVTSYTVTAGDSTNGANGGQATTGPASPITVTGLTNGDSYSFTVTATNSVGTGPASAASNAVVPLPLPVVTSVAPSQLDQGASTTLVITGSNFVTGSEVGVSGTGVAVSNVTVVNSTTITATGLATTSALLGPHDLTVRSGGGTGTCTGCLTINPPPTITSIGPAAVALGATDLVTISGTGFEPGATFTVSIPTWKVNVTGVTSTATMISGRVNLSSSAPVGPFNVIVTNPDGGKVTCTSCFTTIPAPTFVGMSSSSVARRTSTPVSLTGTGFAIGAALTGPTGVTFSMVTAQSATSITATMTVSATATIGTNLAVTVQNSAATGAGKVTSKLLAVGVPGPPKSVTTTAGSGQASVAFKAPPNYGTPAITDYVVTATDWTSPGNGGETVTGTSSPIVVTGLTNFDSYSFIVTAINGVGTGAASAASNVVVPLPPPVVYSVTPGQLGQGASKALIITGSNFVAGSVVGLSGTGVTMSKVTVVNSTTITATAAATTSAVTGPQDLTVRSGGSTGTCTGCLTINPPPVISSISPPAVALGAADPVAITGTGFEPGATFTMSTPTWKVNITGVTSTATTVSGSVNPQAAAPLGNFNVTVTNSDGGRAICASCFATIPAPTFTAMSPSSVSLGTSTPVTFTGTGFAAGVAVTGPAGVTFSTATVQSATTVTAIMKVSGKALTGTNLAVTVQNSGAAGAGKVTSKLLNISSAAQSLAQAIWWFPLIGIGTTIS